LCEEIISCIFVFGKYSKHHAVALLAASAKKHICLHQAGNRTWAQWTLTGMLPPQWQPSLAHTAWTPPTVNL
jgi:hypothetical protein